MSARSLLYVPGVRADRFDKAAASGTDAIILDLEDAVPFADKERARNDVAAWLQARGAVAGGPEIWVRINGGDALEPDARAMLSAGARGLYLPKASVSELERLDHVLGANEAQVTALVETADAIFDVRAIAAAPRVVRLAIGEADLGADLGVDPSPDMREFLPFRMMMVAASSACKLDPPAGSITTDFSNLDALRASSEALRRMGFGGRAAIHPAQVAVINDVFTPSADEIDAARDLLARFTAANGGVCLDASGRMVDEAIARAARTTLARSDRP